MHWETKKIKKLIGLCTKVLLIFAFLFLAFSTQQQENIVQAQTTLPPCTSGVSDSVKGVCGDQSIYSMTQEEAAAANAAKAGNTSIGQDIAELIAKVIYVFTVGLGSSIAFVASYFFNFAVFISLNSTAYAVDFLAQSWTQVRDIANMGFIFILIYIAINITLSAETGKTMQTLVRVVTIALIINFSFFFVRMVIDGGNILAINFYNATTDQTVEDSLQKADLTTNITSTAVSTLSGGSKGAKDLTANIMGAIQITNILNEKSFKAFAQNNSQSTDGGFFTMLIALSFIYISVGIIFGLLAAMFFTVGIKFITRVVVLWIVIIAAPLALLMYAIPNSKAQGYFSEWLKALITYSVYPAIFLFLYIIIIKFTLGLAGGGSLIGNVFTSVNDSNAIGLPYILGLIANISIRFGFVMILLYLAMQASNAVSKMGGSLAQKITARPDALLGSLAFGGVGWVGRNTVGRGAYNLSRSETMRDLASKSIVGRALWRGTTKVGGSSFDARGVGKGEFLKDAHVGKAGGKGGFQAAVAAKGKGFEDEAKKLKDSEVENAYRAKRQVAFRNRNAGVEEKLKTEKTIADNEHREAEATMRETDTFKNISKIEKRIAAGDTSKATKEELKEAKTINTSTSEYRTFSLAQARAEQAKARLDAHKQDEINYAGKNNDKQRIENYANDIGTPKLRNVWWPSQGAVVGADKARKLVREKNTGEKLLDAIQAEAKKTAKEEADAGKSAA